MNCEQARHLCHDRLDGLIEACDDASLSAHLATCNECHIYCAQMGELSDTFAGLARQSELVGRADAAAGFAPATVQRPPYAPAWLRIGRVAAAIALLVGGGYYAYRAGGPLPPEQPTTVEVDAPGVPVIAQAAQRPARIALTGASIDDLMFVRHETKQPRVHLFRLHHVFKAPQDEGTGETDAASDS